MQTSSARFAFCSTSKTMILNDRLISTIFSKIVFTRITRVRMDHLTQARGTRRWKSVHRPALQPLVEGLVSELGSCASLLRCTP